MGPDWLEVLEQLLKHLERRIAQCRKEELKHDARAAASIDASTERMALQEVQRQLSVLLPLDRFYSDREARIAVIAELTRLRAENERLRELLDRVQRYAFSVEQHHLQHPYEAIHVAKDVKFIIGAALEGSDEKSLTRRTK